MAKSETVSHLKSFTKNFIRLCVIPSSFNKDKFFRDGVCTMGEYRYQSRL